jgi:hypothetical protein
MDDRWVVHCQLHECGALEATVDFEMATVVVEAVMAPVKVVVEAEPSSGTHRRSAQEAHSARAPPSRPRLLRRRIVRRPVYWVAQLERPRWVAPK